MKIIDQVKQWVHGGKKQFDEAWDAEHPGLEEKVGGNNAFMLKGLSWQIFQLQVELEDLRKNLKKE